MMKRFGMLLLVLALLTGAASAEWYYNPEGGTRYHEDANCPSVNSKYLPMKQINNGRAMAEGLIPCQVCVDVRGYYMQGESVVHMREDCTQLLGMPRPVLIVKKEDVEAWGLTPCPYCSGEAVSDTLHADERWYDPLGGQHFHRGGVDCTATAAGAYDRRQIAAVVNGQYTAAEDGRLLLPCGVCRPYGDDGKLVIYRVGENELTLHTSVYCAKIKPCNRASNMILTVPYGSELAKEAVQCALCMGSDEACVYAWYNTKGGTKLHRVRDCRTMSDVYYAYVCGVLREEAQEMLYSGFDYCTACWAD